MALLQGIRPPSELLSFSYPMVLIFYYHKLSRVLYEKLSGTHFIALIDVNDT